MPRQLGPNTPASRTGIAPLPAWALVAAVVVGSAITVAYSLRFWWGAFATRPKREPSEIKHRPEPGFVFAPILLGLACHYSGRRMRITVSEPLRWRPDPDADGPATEQEQIADMMQQVCEFFAAQITAHPADWHMMRPIFRRG